MATIKIALCLLFLTNYVYSNDLHSNVILKNDCVSQPLGEATKSIPCINDYWGLKPSEADKLLQAIIESYESTSTPLERANKCRNALDTLYPNYSNAVVINFSNYAIHTNYGVDVTIDGDRVLAFGEMSIPYINHYWGLKPYEADKLLQAIIESYESTSTPLERANKCRNTLDTLYPKYTNAVVINFSNYAIRTNYGVDVTIDGDRVLAFGEMPIPYINDYWGLTTAESKQLLKAITEIYESTSLPLERANKYRNILDTLHPDYNNTVVINWSDKACQPNYGIDITIDGDRVFGFGQTKEIALDV